MILPFSVVKFPNTVVRIILNARATLNQTPYLFFSVYHQQGTVRKDVLKSTKQSKKNLPLLIIDLVLKGKTSHEA